MKLPIQDNKNSKLVNFDKSINLYNSNIHNRKNDVYQYNNENEQTEKELKCMLFSYSQLEDIHYTLNEMKQINLYLKTKNIQVETIFNNNKNSNNINRNNSLSCNNFNNSFQCINIILI